MKFEITSFAIGSTWPIVVGTTAYLVGNHLRHKCKHKGCGCHTKRVYRLLPLHDPTNADGQRAYAVYKFRICGHDHVEPSMKTKWFYNWQIDCKPPEEFVWKSEYVDDLCKKAGIVNPGLDYLFGNHGSQPSPTISPLKKGDTSHLHRPKLRGHFFPKKED